MAARTGAKWGKARAGAADDQQVAEFANQQVAELQRKYGDGFYRLARSRGLCHLDALNVVQTSLVAMWKRLTAKGPVKNDLAYFSTVVNNQINQFFRDQKNAKEEPSGDIGGLFPAAAQPDDQQPGKGWQFRERLMLQAANSAVQELSEPHRAVYELAVYAQVEPKVIAETLNKNPATVRAYLSEARKHVEERAHELLAALELRDSPTDCEKK
jgi:RNA polymerase sigma factor (sigma-70 family)